MITIKKISLICLFSLITAVSAKAELPKENLYTLYNQANEIFRQANSEKDSEQAEKLYQKAILNFEKIVEQGQVENAGLYYNLANAYFLKGRLGKAVLNYRRAEKIDSSDENIRKNLAFARTKKIDQIELKTEKRVLQTLFFWHYDFSLKTRFLLACIFFGIASLCATAVIRFGRNAALTAPAITFAVLTLCLTSSVILEYKTQANSVCGVITAEKIVARQGDGENYSPSFKEPLHEGTEFDLLENRPGWFHIKLSDGSDGWIPDNTAELI